MSTALYRRYRPETFADVIGQEHVTGPLMAAIDKDRINHAYLFSGPRGCGKTTSARILARCLNCAQGPTSTPCGTCDSCVELARNGSGSLDVIEIDAASHGGVDDARDLRERATFAPVRDRFKIFIIDEAHMVTSAGFNALLKIVEEPPEHILFIFATTEPDKVIGTIRSRTHHYPFRLVPPEPLMAYLELLCHQENVPVAPGVLSLVIRAGGGSVRDSLSVLDQLMAGAGENGLDYELAVSLLGYTHATLLDDVVDSVAAGDAATVFNAVDRVIQTGHDPRRFVEDLLERFRDLIVINAVPEGAASVLRGVPDDQLNRMRAQANQLGAGELSRAADVTNTALTEMTGATSPRLHLELLCARLLLPAADATARGTLARVDRIERRLEYAAGTPAGQADADVDVPKAPVRPRLDVPRTAEEAAARWSLPSADPVTPAAPAAVPGAHSPAVPAAASTRPPAGNPAPADSSPDWGGSWGVSTDSAFSDPAPSEQPAPAGSAGSTGQDQPAANGVATEGTQDSPQESAHPATAVPSDRQGPSPVQPVTAPAAPQQPAQQPVSVQQPGAPVTPAAAVVPAQGDPSREGLAGGPRSAPGSRDRQGTAPGSATPDQDRQAAASWSAPAPQQGSPQGGQGHPQHEVRRPDAAQQGSPQGGQGHPQHEVRRPDAAQQGQPVASGGNVEMVRRAWPEIMDEVARIKRATWLIVNVAAKPRSFEGNQLVLAFANQGNAIGFQRGPHMDNLKQAIHKVLGLTCSIEAIHDAGGSGESGPKVPAGQAAPGSTQGPDSSAPSVTRGGSPTASDAAAQPPVKNGPEGRPDGSAGRSGGTGSDTPAVPSGPDAGRPVGSAAPAGIGALQATGGPARDTGSATSPASTPASTPQPGSMQSPAAGPGTAIPADAPTPSGPTRPSVAPRTGSHPAGTPARAAEPSDGPTSERRLQGAHAASPAAGNPRASGGRSTRNDPTASEAVSAWDPSMSDDSWALVEPPEEAFDPGPGWDAVPQDPYEQRASGAQGAAALHSVGVPAPDRAGTMPQVPAAMRRSESSVPAMSPADGTPPAGTSARTPQRAATSRASGPASAPAPQAVGPAPAPQIPGPAAAPRAAESANAPRAAEPVPSRSVVWSPSVEPASPREEGIRKAPPPQGPASGVVGDSPSMTADAPGPVRSVGAAPAKQSGILAPDRPASAENVRQKPVSRYQQLLDEAERKRTEEAAAARGAADLRFVEDEPSADDETIEESGLVGRTAIERILNGRLIEERSVDGQ